MSFASWRYRGLNTFAKSYVTTGSLLMEVTSNYRCCDGAAPNLH